MFNALLFVQRDANAQAIEQLAVESGQVLIQRVITNLSPSFELTILLNTWNPDLIFLDLSDWGYAAESRSGRSGQAFGDSHRRLRRRVGGRNKSPLRPGRHHRSAHCTGHSESV